MASVACRVIFATVYLAPNGDAIDDSEKIWHPLVLESEDDTEGVTAIASAYLARLEGAL